jgi:hypothetical protein
MSDRLIGLIGLIFGILGLAVGVFAAIDIRRQRSRREKAVIAARAVIERAYGSLIHLKAAIVGLGSGQPDSDTHKVMLAAINDTLEAINQQRDSIQSL